MDHTCDSCGQAVADCDPPMVIHLMCGLPPGVDLTPEEAAGQCGAMLATLFAKRRAPAQRIVWCASCFETHVSVSTAEVGRLRDLE